MNAKRNLTGSCSKPSANFVLVWGGVLCVSIFSGCQSTDHPWKGVVYKEPNGVGNPISSTYAPMPQILPQVTVDTTNQSQPSNEPEEFDMDLSELLNQLKQPKVIRR